MVHALNSFVNRAVWVSFRAVKNNSTERPSDHGADAGTSRNRRSRDDRCFLRRRRRRAGTPEVYLTLVDGEVNAPIATGGSCSNPA